MSYDVYLSSPRCDKCGHFNVEVTIGNYTSNVSRMWTDALGMHMSELEAMTSEVAIPILDMAVERMNDPSNYDKYKAMEPSNGWGNFEGARIYLTSILTEWRAHPWCRIVVSN